MALDLSGFCDTLCSMRCIIAFFLTASIGLAECPEAPDFSAEMDVLVQQARAAENDMAGRAVSGKMWQLWLQAPDEAAQELLSSGMARREVFDFIGAEEAFSKLIDYCPNYAEGFNQRAFVAFLSEDFDAALVDLDKTLTLNPQHVGAQSGRALTLMNLGRLPEARRQLLEALENNPWLFERFLLSAGGPLDLPGEEL